MNQSVRRQLQVLYNELPVSFDNTVAFTEIVRQVLRGNEGIDELIFICSGMKDTSHMAVHNFVKYLESIKRLRTMQYKNLSST
jgi:hypothetical protein